MIGRPGSSRATSSLRFAAVVVALVVGLLPDLRRPGYSPDEEFTQFAVRGIRAHGLPLLPSGLLYDRGLAVFLRRGAGQRADGARAAGAAGQPGRAAGALARALRRAAPHGRPGAAALAAALAGGVAAVLGLGDHGAVLRAVPARLSRRCWRRWRGCRCRGERWRSLAAAAAAARWTHELAFTLVAVPVVRGAARPAATSAAAWIVRAVAVAAGLAAGQAAILAVHAAGAAVERRRDGATVLRLAGAEPARASAVRARGDAARRGGLRRGRRAGAGGDSRPGRPAGGGAAGRRRGGRGPRPARAWRRRWSWPALPLVPGRGPTTRAHRAGVLVAGAGFWIVALVAAGLPLGEAVAPYRQRSASSTRSTCSRTSLRETPLLTAATLGGLLARAAGLGGAWPAPQRGLHALWIGWVLWFGVIESGITARYLLLPVTFMLCAAGGRRHGDAVGRPPPGRAPGGGRAGGPGRRRRHARDLGRTAAAHRPGRSGAADAGRSEPLRAELQPDDLVAGHDELADAGGRRTHRRLARRSTRSSASASS